MTQRTDRVDELLRQEIGQIIAREIADPRVGFATITDVETTQDLRHAKVWVSVIGPAEERRATISALEHAMPFVRHQLGKRLRLQRIPQFSVKLDESIERGSRVMQLLNELEAGAQPDELPPGESLPTPIPRMPHAEDAVIPEIPQASSPATSRTRSGQRPRVTRGAATGSGGRGGSGGHTRKSGRS